MKYFVTAMLGVSLCGAAFSQTDEGAKYEIYAVEYAESAEKVPMSAAAAGGTSADSTAFGYYFWYLKGNNGKRILVDAGCLPDSTRRSAPVSFYHRPDSALGSLGIQPDDITDVIITHPHYDHVGGIALFPNATVWMQKEDFIYFVIGAWQTGGNHAGFEKSDVMNIIKISLDGRLRFVEGDSVEFIEGIRAFTGSKHIYQSQHLVVDGTDEKVLLGSDDDWFYYNLDNLKSITFTLDRDAYVRALIRMKTLVPNTSYIIPGHDPAVMKRFPRAGEEVVRID